MIEGGREGGGSEGGSSLFPSFIVTLPKMRKSLHLRLRAERRKNREGVGRGGATNKFRS